MEITEVRVALRNEERLKGYATITFDNCFVVRNIRIVQGQKGIMVCMPSRKLSDGTHRDVAHPINNDFRYKIEDKVLAAYNDELKKGSQQGSNT
ncbi:MAG: septation regulator SpoVG [Elusimicrobia bacterium]|nr:septation regulator SpoVG [Elusimicrobiota bacterium]MBD3412751.1 septation regulator SpoVG [Elusimicrobiota bacterium]